MREMEFSGFSKARAASFVSCLALLAIGPGCPLPTAKEAATLASSASSGTSTSTSTTTTSSAPAVIAGTPRAVKIIFRQAYPSGSFDAPSSSGTTASPGHGLQAARVFNPDGSLLAASPSASSWPKWLSGFEIGISGPSNASATNSACAKFADSSEYSATNCKIGGVAKSCGAAAGYFRVSEYDCQSGSGTTAGDGGPSDGVYFRATFDRTQLGTGENVMAVVEYIASAYNAAPRTPSQCFNGGTYSPESCSDINWKAYLKHSVSERVQPFLMLVPPTQNFVNSGLGSSGVSPSARQIYLPLAGDPSLKVLQVSRISSPLSVSDASFSTACAGSTTPTLPVNTPLCAGMVIYSVTLYRM